jgi:hypothetical protein
LLKTLTVRIVQVPAHVADAESSIEPRQNHSEIAFVVAPRPEAWIAGGDAFCRFLRWRGGPAAGARRI